MSVFHTHRPAHAIDVPLTSVTWVVSADDRTSFKRCRRAWDFGASTRRRLEPVGGHAADRPADRFLRAALAVHYFPGMWTWDREIVRPLTLKAAGPATALVERYIDWAAVVDEFVPLRVEADFEAGVPDPRADDCDLATRRGEAVRYRGRIDALVVDADGDHWLMIHRLGPWSDGNGLRLDEAAVASAWGWENEQLSTTIRGVLFNEISPEGRFRRSVRRLSRFQVVDAGLQLGWEAIDMLDRQVSLYPTPAAHCAACPFVGPCLSLSEHGDAEAILADAYRPRPPDVSVEGRLGGSTWGLGRGAAPPKIGSG